MQRRVTIKRDLERLPLLNPKVSEAAKARHAKRKAEAPPLIVIEVPAVPAPAPIKNAHDVSTAHTCTLSRHAKVEVVRLERGWILAFYQIQVGELAIVCCPYCAQTLD